MSNFFATLYAASWFGLAFSTIGWFIFKRALLGTKVPLWALMLFGALFLVSLLGVQLQNGGANTLELLFRETGVLVGIALVCRLWSSQKSVPLLAALALGVSAWYGYFGYIQRNAGFVAQIDNTSPSVPPAAASVANLPPAVPDEAGEILFDLKRPEDLPALTRLLTPYGASLTRAFPVPASPEATELDDYYVINLPPEQSGQLEGILAILAQSGKTDDQEINETLALDPAELQATGQGPSLPLAPMRFPVDDPFADSLRHFQILDYPKVFEYLSARTPAKKARIAILDTGVDAQHEDISANYRSFGTQHDRDVAAHGTHCAGIAAAVANNAVGIASLAGLRQWVEVGSVKILSDRGSGSEQTIIAGIITAADQGADVISMSLGGPRRPGSTRAYDQAIQYANSKGAIVVVAAGNENRAANTRLPAGSAYAITVSAVDDYGHKAGFSNWFTNATEEMGIAAPGVGIFSTLPGNRYGRFSGTSMATPCVAGLLGLMKAAQPNLDTRAAYKLLNDTGADSGDTGKTGKIVQPARVLAQGIQ